MKVGFLNDLLGVLDLRISFELEAIIPTDSESYDMNADVSGIPKQEGLGFTKWDRKPKALTNDILVIVQWLQVNVAGITRA